MYALRGLYLTFLSRTLPMPCPATQLIQNRYEYRQPCSLFLPNKDTMPALSHTAPCPNTETWIVYKLQGRNASCTIQSMKLSWSGISLHKTTYIFYMNHSFYIPQSNNRCGSSRIGSDVPASSTSAETSILRISRSVGSSTMSVIIILIEALIPNLSIFLSLLTTS